MLMTLHIFSQFFLIKKLASLSIFMLFFIFLTENSLNDCQYFILFVAGWANSDRWKRDGLNRNLPHSCHNGVFSPSFKTLFDANERKDQTNDDNEQPQES